MYPTRVPRTPRRLRPTIPSTNGHALVDGFTDIESYDTWLDSLPDLHASTNGQAPPASTYGHQPRHARTMDDDEVDEDVQLINRVGRNRGGILHGAMAKLYHAREPWKAKRPRTLAQAATPHGEEPPLRYFRIANEFFDESFTMPPLVKLVYSCFLRLANQQRKRHVRGATIIRIARMCSLSKSTVINAIAYLQAVRVPYRKSGKTLAPLICLRRGYRGSTSEWFVPPLSAFLRAGGGSWKPLHAALRRQNQRVSRFQ